jgi:protein-disulfide isomerase
VQQQRAQRALEQRRRRRRMAAFGVAAVVVIAAVVGVLVGTHQSRPTSSQGTAVPPGVTAAGGIVVGSSTARQQVVLYEDPQCPVCGRFEKSTAQVLAEGVKRGTVAVEYRMRSFLGPESVRAVNALGAAQAGGRFEAFREQMYAEQPAERTGGFTSDDLIALGARVGLTGKGFTDAVKDMKYGRWVHQVDDQASIDGNVATPEMRLNGKVVPQRVLFDQAALAKLLQVSA